MPPPQLDLEVLAPPPSCAPGQNRKRESYSWYSLRTIEKPVEELVEKKLSYLGI